MGNSDDMKWRVGVVILVLLNIQIALFIPSATAQQILPGIELECSTSSIVIHFDEVDSSNQIIECILTNDRPYVEEVSLEYISEYIDTAGPGNLMVEGNSDTSFQVIIDVDNSLIPQIYELNITAEVISAIGIPLGFLTEVEEWAIEIEIMEYTICNVNYGINSLNVEGGENALFTAAYNCESNLDRELDVELHLVDKNANSESTWASGFNLVSDKCTILISEGSGFENCEFELTTPSNIDEKYEGCLIVLDERTTITGSCQSEDSLEFIVNPKENGIINGVGGNISVLDDYDISEKQIMYFSSAFFILIVLFIAFFRYRR
tara:strand:+ start:29821 stop:30783 length:963 start_codon:yes stop_codon:yes gene_type:complete